MGCIRDQSTWPCLCELVLTKTSHTFIWEVVIYCWCIGKHKHCCGIDDYYEPCTCLKDKDITSYGHANTIPKKIGHDSWIQSRHDNKLTCPMYVFIHEWISSFFFLYFLWSISKIQCASLYHALCSNTHVSIHWWNYLRTLSKDPYLYIDETVSAVSFWRGV